MMTRFSSGTGRFFGNTGRDDAAKHTRLIAVSGSIAEKNSPADRP